MFKLEDGREHLWQWDLDRRVIVEDTNVCEVHFCNRTTDCSLVVKPYMDNGIYVAKIPNILLQEARPIRCYAYVDDKYTLVEEQFSVKSRTRPDDYVYTETDTITVSNMVERAEQVLEQATESLSNSETALINANAAVETANTTNERLETAVSDCETHAVEAKESAELAQAAVVNYYTKEETDTLISDSKDSIYLDVQNIGINAAEVVADQASVLDRLASGEVLSIYLKINSIEYCPARIILYHESSITLTTPDYPNDFSGDVFSYEYHFTKSGDTWTAKRTDEYKPKLVTHDELETYVDEKIAEIPDVDLSDYYTKTETDTAIQNAVDAIDIPEVDLTGYATENYVDNAIANIDIPTVPTNVSAFTNDAGYLTEHQSLEGYALKTDIPDVSSYQTEDQVNALIQTALSNIATAEGGSY